MDFWLSQAKKKFTFSKLRNVLALLVVNLSKGPFLLFSFKALKIIVAPFIYLLLLNHIQNRKQGFTTFFGLLLEVHLI